MRAKEKHSVVSRKPSHTRERADFWRTDLRTMQRWKSRRPPLPVDDVAAMVRWYAGQPTKIQQKLTPEFRARVTELRIELESGPAGPQILDPDLAEFDKKYTAEDAKDTDALAHLKRYRDFSLFKIGRAQGRNDFAAVQDATRLLNHYSSIIHDEEIRAQKLGRELGDLVPRRALSDFMENWMLASLRGVDDAVDAIVKAICSRSSELFRDEVRAIVEGELLSIRVLAPMQRAASAVAPMALPGDLVDEARKIAATYIKSAP
jgi:hypothetical protein